MKDTQILCDECFRHLDDIGWYELNDLELHQVIPFNGEQSTFELHFSILNRTTAKQPELCPKDTEKVLLRAIEALKEYIVQTKKESQS